MELSIKVEDLRKNKLFIATPMYGGMCNGLYMKACLDLQGMANQYGIEIRFSFLFNESLITRARNYLVDEFLRSGYTHLLFIDSDILFDPRDVLALLALDKDIIGGPYPKKSINWKNVFRGAEKIINTPAFDKTNFDFSSLEGLAGDYVFNPVPGTKQFKVTEPLEVMEIGTGFMMVKRQVFDRFKESYPHLNYKPDHVGQSNFDGSRYIHAYFDTVIDRGYTFEDVNRIIQAAANGEDVKERAKSIIDIKSSDRYLSEDYMFCQYWRAIGGQIWLCPWMKTTHVGTYGFQGDMPKIAEMVGNL